MLLRRLFVLMLLLMTALTLVPVAAAQGDGRFEPGECPFDVPASQTVDCGTLFVPEDRSDPNSIEIALAVAIVRADGTALPDPIVYLEGGPGGSALTGIDSWYNTPFNPTRDIVLIDQRGTGYSEPGLFCVDEGDDMLEATELCRDDLISRGVDLSAYTSAANAADIESLRLALGYDEINLYGVSYGTRLAMTVMRDFPDGIRSVVLDSPYPPAADAYNDDGGNFYYALQTLAADCAANASCNSAFPDLESAFVDLVNSANDNPIVADLGNGEQDLFGTDIIEAYYGYFYDTTIIPYLPALIYDLREGSVDALIAFEDSLPFEDEGGADMGGEGDFIDFDAMSDEEFEAFLMDELGYSDVDDLFDYLDSLSDDEYNDLLDEIAAGGGAAADGGDMGGEGDFIDLDAMSDEEFDALLMDELGYDNLDDLYDYLDSLSDDEFNNLLDEIAGFGNDMGGDDGDFIDPEDISDASGMFNSVTCAEEIPFTDAAAQSAQLAAAPAIIREHFVESLDIALETCDIWGVELSGAIEDEIVVSDIPTLILVGQYDVATPPRWAELAAEGLSNVYVVEFPGVGHAVIDATPCANEISTTFVDAPSTALDTSCAPAIGAPNFYVP